MNILSTNPLATFQTVWKHGPRSLKMVALVGLAFATLGFALKYLAPDYLLERIGNILVGISLAIWFFLEAGLRAKQQAEIEARVERAERAVEENPDKTRPLWDLARSRLELYFERNLSQIRSIFWITLLVMGAGFLMIGYGIVRAFDEAALKPSIVAAASGILTEFIAATFLIIYRSTMSQASDYVATLERINAVGMSIQIVDTIPDASGELKDKVRAELVSKILDVFSPQAENSASSFKRHKALTSRSKT
jgi:hypothetical protein